MGPTFNALHNTLPWSIKSKLEQQISMQMKMVKKKMENYRRGTCAGTSMHKQVASEQKCQKGPCVH